MSLNVLENEKKEVFFGVPWRGAVHAYLNKERNMSLSDAKKTLKTIP